ncbi:hypothetical protein PC120_g3069 [Phytophthora cactorum]|nr:hypothetical protein PC120_g3069 [Phytophthora cactorum]
MLTDLTPSAPSIANHFEGFSKAVAITHSGLSGSRRAPPILPRVRSDRKFLAEAQRLLQAGALVSSVTVRWFSPLQDGFAVARHMGPRSRRQSRHRHRR